MPPAIYLPEAADDVTDARAGYEARAAGLGDRFLDAVGRAVARVEANPRLYGEVADGIRACPTRRFPFVVYYREDAGRVIVIAVRHGRDAPAIWPGRV
jgi:plasmid stabilization system protein ParE